MFPNNYCLSLKALNKKEIVHHADDEIMISSHFNSVNVVSANINVSFKLPLPFYLYLIGLFRLFRRVLRLDKSSIALSQDRTSLVITYGGYVYSYCLKLGELHRTLKLEQCRTVLHMSIASLSPKTFILGEYGRNKERAEVPIYISQDGGKTWNVPFTFPANSIRHIHGIYHDRFTGHIWVPTGDFEGECYIYEFEDITLSNPVVHGDGSQVWRTVSVFFSEKTVVWAMDSELETSHLVIMDRGSGKISKGRVFPGPIWYIKSLMDGWHLLQTTVENGEGVVSKNVHIYISNDLENWQEIAVLPHDGLPLRYFKNAVVAFANGAQSSQKFYLSAEAIKGMDGKSFECKLNNSEKNLND
ncbi:MAG: hypothetical protein COB38_11470 [Gammaproteobacteria bacterium]|nr:MAG: hypothetical protein COB38_11470 [Gammaproteobacteria bacterium]